MKKGFTLLEMLAVIVIITLITLMVATNLLNGVNNKRKDISNTAKQMIYDATDIYVKENSTSYPIEENAIYCIKLETLVNSGRLSNPVKDLKNDKEIPLNYYVKTTINQYNQYNYNLVDNNSCIPAIAYHIVDNNKYTKEKAITIKYPQSNYVKKYMVLSGTTKENITLNTEQTTTENPTITFTTNGSIKFWVEDNGEIVGNEPTTITINKIDTTAPTLTLAKKTYIEEDFSDWTLTNATVTEEDGHKVLVLGSNGNEAGAISPYYETNGDTWYPDYEVFTSNALDNSVSGGCHNSMTYYDSNYELTNSNSNTSTNGVAFGTDVNTWTSSLTDNRYRNPSQGKGGNIKYVKFQIITGNQYSKPPVKVRNFKFYAENMPNSFYLINVTASDSESKIKSIKYAKGDKNSKYFENAGDRVENNQIRVTSNGVYSVCVTDNAGNMTIQKITIDKIN